MNEFVSIEDAAAELGWTVEAFIDQMLLDGLLLEIDGELIASPHPYVRRVQPAPAEVDPVERVTLLIPEDAEILETVGEDGLSTISADGDVIAVYGDDKGPATTEILASGWFAVALEEINGSRVEIYHRL